MKSYLLIVVLLVVALSGCSSAKVGDPVYASHLKNIRSDLVITYCDKEVELKHIAALEWFDANKVVEGQPASSISQFLALALAKTSKKGVTIYKFPLAPPAGNHVLSDEPRPQYNHYCVRVDEDTGLISGKGFNRYTW